MPLLFEKKFDTLLNFDYIICVLSSKKNQNIRLLKRGMKEKDIVTRLSFQFSQKEKAQKSHFVINNNQSLKKLKLNIINILNKINNNLLHNESLKKVYN